MGYYMRFVVAGGKSPSFGDIAYRYADFLILDLRREGFQPGHPLHNVIQFSLPRATAIPPSGVAIA